MKDFFISYNKEDRSWAEWVAWTLEEAGYSVVIQAWDFRPGENFALRMQDAASRTRVTIAILSENYLKAEYTQPEWVAAFTRDPKGEHRALIPIRVDNCKPKGILHPIIYEDFVGLSEEESKIKLLQLLNERVKPEKRPEFPDRNFPQHKNFPRIDVADYFSQSWPVTDPFLIGRDKEVALLDDAWENPNINIINLIAFGGVGKTALLDWWRIHHMQPDGWRGAQRVFAWSFYNQGIGEGEQASADLFIGEALRWFGDPEMAESARSPWEKGLHLAKLVREQRTLLLLDGLEPLQESIGLSFEEEGRLKDPAVRGLLCTLASGNPGLCVITTRLRVEDIKAFEGSSVCSIDLDQLSIESSVKYLCHLGVKGPEAELRQIAEDYGGHALALTLLGRYLAVVYDGDVFQRIRIPLTSEPIYGSHAKRVIECYERWLRTKPGLEVLCILSLFDRPAESGAIEFLRNGDPIQGLTDQVKSLSEADWRFTINSLRNVRLLTDRNKNADKEDQLDCHPLVREYFSESLKAQKPGAWREAHSRLYEYYQSSPPHKKYPETLGELEPLYRAVAHGCQAERFKEALNEVYKKRILRGEYYSWKKYGNFGTELVALSKFFDYPWNRVVDSLDDTDKGFILNEVGFHLMALARLKEAAYPMRAALELFEIQKDIDNIALCGSNLCKLYLALGNLEESITCADHCLALVNESQESYQQVGLIVAKGATLHQLGRFDDAHDVFRSAENLHQALRPKTKYPLLYAFRGYRYCDLLLDIGDIYEIQRRTEKVLEALSIEEIPYFALGISHLFLEQACLFLFFRGVTSSYYMAEDHMGKAMEYLSRAGQQVHITRSFLACAELQRIKGCFVDAQRNLDEALEIATRSCMKCLECDAHLEYCRWIFSMERTANEIVFDNPLVIAGDHLSKAKSIIAEIGYRRREPEVLLETARLRFYEGSKDLARQALYEATISMNEMNCHRWDHIVQELEDMV